MKKILYPILCLLIFISACKKADTIARPSEYDTERYGHEVATSWMDLELRLIRNTPGFTSPVAARALGYTGLTLYETVYSGTPGYRSLKETLGYTYAPASASKSLRYNWAIAVNVAMKNMIQSLFSDASAQNQAVIDSLYKAMLFKLQPGVTADVTSRSEALGNGIATAIFEWSKTDNGHEGYRTNFPSDYTVPTGEGMWVPTIPDFQSIPLQPYWGNVRPFIAQSVTGSCMLPPPLAFSTDTSSEYFRQAMEVYTISKNLTDAQKNTALYWADGENTVTPPGHYMSLVTQTLKADNANLAIAAEAYLRMGLAQSDAAVACWKSKYMYNTMSPVSYIRQYIDAEWLPLVSTSPCPEYGSAHATYAGAAAEVFLKVFGNDSVTDRTNNDAGFTSRTFTGIDQIAEEIAMSTIYAGIQYRNSNDKALTCGREIGKNVAGIKLKQ